MTPTLLASNAVFLALQVVYYQKDRSGVSLPLSCADFETKNLLNTFIKTHLMMTGYLKRLVKDMATISAIVF
jgi:hypothetical protein